LFQLGEGRHIASGDLFQISLTAVLDHPRKKNEGAEAKVQCLRPAVAIRQLAKMGFHLILSRQIQSGQPFQNL
jgi:hypothetical protein